MPQPLPQEDWETIPLPGMVSDDTFAKPPIASEMAATPVPSTGSRETELLARIRDLNQCNEVLLSRINQLEEALERSQQALQHEVEQSHRLTQEEKLATAQTRSMAQLLSELEQSNAALERQTILSETLQAQLETFQDRSKHLERECAVLRKRHGEKAHLVQELEETCADLRSRLQRQQRYTLQFKAALEKCLETAAGHRSVPHHPAVEPEAFLPDSGVISNPLMMPRSERIQPWSASAATESTDPQLLSLMRSLQEPEPDPPSPTTEPFPTRLAAPRSTPAPPIAPVANVAESETEQAAAQQLWQDVERVIENAAPTPPDPIPTVTSPSVEEPAVAQFTEPIPWGAPLPKAPEGDPAVTIHAPEKPVIPSASGGLEPEPLTADTAMAAPSHRPPSVPTEYRKTSFAASSPTIPALDAMQTAQPSPSPIVHPLRPAARKRKSLSAVELPSFPPLPKVPNTRPDGGGQ